MDASAVNSAQRPTRSARVIAASNRASAGVYEDRTGPVIVEWLRERGYDTPNAAVVPDGEPVGAALRAAVATRVDVVITTGGTGINPTDRTPEVTRSVLDFEVAGLADAIRAAGLPGVPTAVLSRAVAGVAGRTLVVNLPGSRGGVRDGLGVLAGVLDHAVDQLHGGDHVRHGGDHAVHNGDHVPHSGDHVPHNGDHVPHNGDHAVPGGGPSSQTGHTPAQGASGREHGVDEQGVDEHGVVVLRAEVSLEPLSVDEHADLVTGPAAGAVVTFGGVVRDHDGGKGVRELEYVGHPSASALIAEVARDVARQHADVRALAVSHRLGLLGIGDVALACAVAAGHRKEAFAACADLVDEVKRRLPVWKRQLFTDGSEEWVNCP